MYARQSAMHSRKGAKKKRKGAKEILFLCAFARLCLVKYKLNNQS